MRSMARSFSRIVRFLRTEVPATHRALRPPASESALLRIPVAFRRHPELVAFYRLHGGTRGHEPFINGGRLLSVRQAAQVRATLLQECEDLEGSALTVDPRLKNDRAWRRGWWPLTDAEGDGFVLDLDPGPKGSPGQVFGFDLHGGRPDVVVASSLGEWLEAIATAIDAGRAGPDATLGMWIEELQA